MRPRSAATLDHHTGGGLDGDGRVSFDEFARWIASDSVEEGSTIRGDDRGGHHDGGPYGERKKMMIRMRPHPKKIFT